MSSSAQDSASLRGWRLQWRLLNRRMERLDSTVRGLLWTTSAGILFCMLNTVLRTMTLQLDPFQAQFMRYLCGIVVMLPLIARSGVRDFIPHNISGQFVRGGVHTLGLSLWFVALPHISLADMTSIGFTGPIFIMIGAALFFKEPMLWDRWMAAIIGFIGVIVVVAPNLSGRGGGYNLIMLASAPVFAGSYLLTKALTRYESAKVIVLWQCISVSLLSLPLALMHWQAPTLLQWTTFLAAGVLGVTSHYCLTRSFAVADISATQSVKFLDLVWSCLLGWLAFGDAPSQSTLIGGIVICSSTIWIARREARAREALRRRTQQAN